MTTATVQDADQAVVPDVVDIVPDVVDIVPDVVDVVPDVVDVVPDVVDVVQDVVDVVQDTGAAVSQGMPQLDISTFPNQAFWLLVTLTVIFLVLSRVALPRIAAILAERQGAIMGDIAAAEAFKAKAHAAEEVYEKALAEARVEALNIAAETRAEIQNDLNDAIARADAEIAARTVESEKAIAEISASALEAVKVVANDTASEIMAVLGGKATAKGISGAVAAGMKG